MATIEGTSGSDTLFGTADDDIVNGLDGNDMLSGGQGSDVLNGGSGTDTANYSSSAAGVTVDLAAGTGSGGDAQGDTLIGIESVIGSDFSDHLYGGAGNDVLNGSGGDDVLWGGAGADYFLDPTAVVSYRGSSAAVMVDLRIGSGSGGDAEGDRFWVGGSSDLTGSSHNDTLIGNDGANILMGESGSDQLRGEGGDDVLRGGAGGDGLNGGDGLDTVSYYLSSIGVTVDLATGTGHGGDAEGDTLTGFEILSGSQGNDHLTGDVLANTLQGWNGNDVLAGGFGKDVLSGGAGADRFVFSIISDSLTGANADRITDFSRAQGDTIDLSAIDANIGIAGDQAFTFIGTGLYTHHAGELRFATTAPGVTTIAGDVNGDGVSDFHIQLTGSIGLLASDFVL
jgi:Ca2+-binding RTX toxin-like protein